MTRKVKRSRPGAVVHLDEAALRRHRNQLLATWITGVTVLLGICWIVWPGGEVDVPATAAARAAAPQVQRFEITHASWRKPDPDGDAESHPEADADRRGEWQDPDQVDAHRDMADRYQNLDIMVAPR